MEVQFTEYDLTYLKLKLNDHTYPIFESFEAERKYYEKLTEDYLASLSFNIKKGG